MPEAYYAATILQQKIYRPCTVPTTDNMYAAADVMLLIMTMISIQGGVMPEIIVFKF